jgi:hypothetical protein
MIDSGDEVEDQIRIPLEALVGAPERLERLAAFDPQQERIVELRYFGGLTIEDGRALTTVLGWDPDLVELSRRLAREAGVGERATFVQGDMYAADVSQATVLALFLKPENLDRMQDTFLAMKPGTRIVLNTFPITDWDPDVTETLGPPCRTWCTAMLVIVPARVGGSWQMGAATMTLKQYYQVVRGTIGTQAAIGHLRGDRITLNAGDTEYAGQVAGDRIDGFATTAGKRTPWTARLARGVPAIDH